MCKTSANRQEASRVDSGVGGGSTWNRGEVIVLEAWAPGLRARTANKSSYVKREETPTKETTTIDMGRMRTAVVE